MIKPLTKDAIQDKFQKLYSEKDTVLFIHSSLSSFGHVEGGARAVVAGIKNALGPKGTLVAPSFSHCFMQGNKQTWNRQKTPSRMGKISEIIRTWPGSCRSPHPIHPVSAIGRHAKKITNRKNKTDFDRDSPFQALLDYDAWIVLAGVTYSVCTIFHMIESNLNVPYRHWVVRSGTVIDGAKRQFRRFRFFEKYPGVKNDFTHLGKELEAAGKVKKQKIEKCTVLTFRARNAIDMGMQKTAGNPFYLVREDTLKAAKKYF